MIYQYTYQPTTKPMSELTELLKEVKEGISLMKELKQTIKERIAEIEEDKHQQQWHDNALERAHKQLDDMQILKREAEARRLKEWEEQCDREQREDERIEAMRKGVLDGIERNVVTTVRMHRDLPHMSRHNVSRDDIARVMAYLHDYGTKTHEQIINDEFTG
jgi:chromosome segregation ATPase